MNWDDMIFPVSNKDIENKFKKNYLNFFKFNLNGTNKIIVHRITKIQNPSYYDN